MRLADVPKVILSIRNDMPRSLLPQSELIHFSLAFKAAPRCLQFFPVSFRVCVRKKSRKACVL
jgi:hypothetical protein